MPDYNMPSNNLHADIYLKARKLMLIQIAELIGDGSISNLVDIHHFVWSEIEVIDKLIEGE
jgi:hypothetical protein